MLGFAWRISFKFGGNQSCEINPHTAAVQEPLIQRIERGIAAGSVSRSSAQNPETASRQQSQQ